MSKSSALGLPIGIVNGYLFQTVLRLVPYIFAELHNIPDFVDAGLCNPPHLCLVLLILNGTLYPCLIGLDITSCCVLSASYLASDAVHFLTQFCGLRFHLVFDMTAIRNPIDIVGMGARDIGPVFQLGTL